MTKENFKADPNDFIIVIIGPTGSGRTSFINALTRADGKAEQHKLKPDTQSITPHTISYHELRLVFVDTPGFNEACRPDAEIIRVVADWLTKKYPDGTALKIAGIIYLHGITNSDKHMSGSVHKNLQTFGRLCRGVPLDRVRLVTTMWDSVKNLEAAQARETKLTTEFWRELIDQGALPRRFYNTLSSAWDIVEDVLRMGLNELLLQEVLVKQQIRLNETEEGELLLSRFQKLLVEHKKTHKKLQDEAKLRDDPALAKSLQEEYDKINAQLLKTFSVMNEMMKLPRVKLWPCGGKSLAQAVELDHPLV